MATAEAYFSTPDGAAATPGLRHARVVMLAWAVVAAVWVAVAVPTLATSAEGTGVLIGAVLPELVGGVLAVWLARLPRWAPLTLTIVQILLSVADLLGGSARGIVQLVLPIVVLVLLIRGYRQRGAAADPQAGSTFLQWLALAVLAALILAGLAVTGIGTSIGDGAGTVICRIVGTTSCKTEASGTGTKNGGTTGNDGKPDNGKPNDGKPKKPGDNAKCHGFWGCAWHYTGGQVYGLGKGVVKSVYQMGDGLVTSIMHPTQFLKGLDYAAHHPLDAAKSIFLGDAEKDWANGDYGEAIGDVLTNTGSLFIPYADIATGAGDAGKVGKLGELGKLGEAGDLGKAGKLGKLGELAGDADRAAADADKAAKGGDVGGAQKAADKADADAAKAEKQARKDGCKMGALGDVHVTPLLHLGGRFAAPVRDGCGEQEQNNLNKAEQDKKDAHQAINDAWSRKATFPDKSLQHELKHAPDFGVKKGNWNKAMREQFTGKLREFMRRPGVTHFRGTYHNQPVIFFYEKSTHRAIFLRPNGEFWGGWKLSPKQEFHLTRDHKLGGGPK